MIPRLGRSPGEGEGLSTPVFWPGEFHGPNSQSWGGVTKSWTQLSDFHFLSLETVHTQHRIQHLASHKQLIDVRCSYCSHHLYYCCKPFSLQQPCSFLKLLVSYVNLASPKGSKQNPMLADCTSSLSAIPQVPCPRASPYNSTETVLPKVTEQSHLLSYHSPRRLQHLSLCTTLPEPSSPALVPMPVPGSIFQSFWLLPALRSSVCLFLFLIPCCCC